MNPSSWLRLFSVCLLAIGLAALGVVSAHAGEIAPNLKQALLLAEPGEFVPVIVMMDEFPVQNDLLLEVRGLNSVARRDHVIARMRQLAETSQRPVRAALNANKEEVRDVQVLWGINGIALQATPVLIEQLAEMPGVRWVLHDHAEGHAEGTAEGHVEGHTEGPTGGDASGPNPDAIIDDVVIALGADQVWSQLNITGAGVIVAVIDTGIDITHPDIADHIWTNLGEIPGNAIDDDGNGHIDDTWGWDFCTDAIPVGDSHGTQVAGQVAGDGTDGRVTGMAPDAELMGLGIDCDTPSKAFEASDYALAHGAHVISQSYSWWWTDLPDYAAFRRQSDTELAAGVIRASSAGNHGAQTDLYPIPYNISTPANCPAPWIHPDQTLTGGVSSTIAVGDIHFGTDVIASSSSLGPSAWEDIQANSYGAFPHVNPPEYLDYPYENGAQMGLIKPDISAYGSGTTSICPGDFYCGFSGTSSAAPHVSGTMALMLSANPGATPAELAEILMTTAQHRGAPGKNNVYGAGMVQAYDAVTAMGGVYYESHTFDDSVGGNGDLMIDPGELVTMSVTVRNIIADAAVDDLSVVLSTTTPGVTIHDQYATFPTVPALGTATSNAPHFTLSIDPAACATVIAFDLDLRYGDQARRSIFSVRVGEPSLVTVFHDDFESDLGWTSDPGASTQGAWVREDPDGVTDSQSRLTNPEDDSSSSGSVCWVTGNGELGGKKGPDNNDVDGGQVFLLSPPLGLNYMLSLNLTFDDWFYDVNSGNSFRAELSNDGGQNWTLLKEQIYGYGGWVANDFDVFALLAPNDDMRLRFVADDDGTDNPVEAAVDEVRLEGIRVDCQFYTPPTLLAPNPVGDTLAVDADPKGHALLSWSAPPVDGSHDAATLYRIERSASPNGPFVEVGSATGTDWVDVDAFVSLDSFYYRVRAENSGGSE